MEVLVLNAGSSSLKYRLFAMPEEREVGAGLLAELGTGPIPNHAAALDAMLADLGDVDPGAVGHRVVFGGDGFAGPTVATDDVVEKIRSHEPLAPLHNPHNLAGIAAARDRFPEATQVACFDTSFHVTIPPQAHRYAVSDELYRLHGIRRFGFHGTNHEYVARECATRLGIPFDRFNAVTLHLGNGCSVTAIENGQSVDTSMGFTPLAGLVMGTRSGDIDPAVVFYLARRGMALDDIEASMLEEGGLLGLSGISNDVLTLLDRAPGDPRAKLALEVFAHQARKYLGAYAAALPRLDAVVFTGGLGENSGPIRAMIVDGLNPDLGIALDPTSNAVGVEAPIGAGRVPVWSIPAGEELAIARHTWRLVAEPTA